MEEGRQEDRPENGTTPNLTTQALSPRLRRRITRSNLYMSIRTEYVRVLNVYRSVCNCIRMRVYLNIYCSVNYIYKIQCSMKV